MDGWFANKGQVLQAIAALASVILTALAYTAVPASRFFFLIPILLALAILCLAVIVLNNIGTVARLAVELLAGAVGGVWIAILFYGYDGNLIISGRVLGPPIYAYQLEGPVLLSLGVDGSILTVLSSSSLPPSQVSDSPPPRGATGNPSGTVAVTVPAGESVASPPTGGSAPDYSSVPSLPQNSSSPSPAQNSSTPPSVSNNNSTGIVGGNSVFKRIAPLMLVILPTW
jgi:hypothetical protein